MTIKQILQTISKEEWRFVAIITMIMICLTGLPYLYAVLNTAPGFFYTGIHVLNQGDNFVYYSYINQIKEGAWTLRDYFTTEAQSQGLFNWFWLVIGLMARLFHLSAPIAFHLSRLFLLPLFFICIYIFISYFIKEKAARKVAVFFACFSSGLGAYFFSFFLKFIPYKENIEILKTPIDLWIPEANIFSTLNYSPHFVLSLIFAIVFYLLMHIALIYKQWQYSLVAGLIGVFWFNFQPFYFPCVFTVLGVFLLYLVIKDKNYQAIFNYLLALFLCLPVIIYHYYRIKTDLVLAQRASQNILTSPSLIFVIVGFGFLLVFAIFALIILIRKKQLFSDSQKVFLALWMIVGLMLMYAPVFFQRRFSQGLQLPLILLTVYFIFWLKQWLDKKLANKKFYSYFSNNNFLFLILFICLFGFSTFFNITRNFYYFNTHNTIFYRPADYLKVYNWLVVNNSAKQPILCYAIDGILIPAYINQPVYLGHGIETIYYQQKADLTYNFFNQKMSKEQAIAFLKTNNIGYIFMSDIERTYGNLSVANLDYLTKVFTEGQVELYKVN